MASEQLKLKCKQQTNKQVCMLYSYSSVTWKHNILFYERVAYPKSDLKKEIIKTLPSTLNINSSENTEKKSEPTLPFPSKIKSPGECLSLCLYVGHNNYFFFFFKSSELTSNPWRNRRCIKCRMVPYIKVPTGQRCSDSVALIQVSEEATGHKIAMVPFLLVCPVEVQHFSYTRCYWGHACTCLFWLRLTALLQNTRGRNQTDVSFHPSRKIFSQTPTRLPTLLRSSPWPRLFWGRFENPAAEWQGDVLAAWLRAKKTTRKAAAAVRERSTAAEILCKLCRKS